MLKPVMLFMALAVSVTAAEPAVSTKRAITHEDVWLMRRLSAPAPSLDGKWVVYGVTEPAYDAKIGNRSSKIGDRRLKIGD